MITQLSLAYLLGVTLELFGAAVGIFRENVVNTMATDALAPREPGHWQPLYTFKALLNAIFEWKYLNFD